MVCSHRGAYLSAVSSIISCGVPKGSSYLWTLPLFHCNGWCMPWVLVLQAGRTFCLRHMNAEMIVRLISAKASRTTGARIVHTLIRDEAQQQGLDFRPSMLGAFTRRWRIAAPGRLWASFLAVVMPSAFCSCRGVNAGALLPEGGNPRPRRRCLRASTADRRDSLVHLIFFGM